MRLIHRLRHHHWPRWGPYYHDDDVGLLVITRVCYRCLWEKPGQVRNE